MPLPSSFVQCSDIETGNDLWAWNDFQNGKVYVVESWQVQPLMNKLYRINRVVKKKDMEW
jgi:hypothetical protein